MGRVLNNESASKAAKRALRSSMGLRVKQDKRNDDDDDDDKEGRGGEGR